MIKKLLDKLWGNNNKEIINGHWYVRLSDVNELITNAEFITPKKPNEKITMDDLASNLLDKGFIFERNPDNGDIFRRKKGDYNNKEKIS